MHYAPTEGYSILPSLIPPKSSSPPPSSDHHMSTSASKRNRGGLRPAGKPPLQHTNSAPSILQPMPNKSRQHSAALLGYIFYLDMPNGHPLKISIERQLKQLAARVEDQFNGDVVTHVITTRHLTHEQKLKIQQQALSPPLSVSSSSAASTSTSSTLALSSPPPPSPNGGTSSQVVMTSSSCFTSQQPLSIPSITSSSASLSLSTLSPPGASTSPNSPFSSSPSSPYSCHPASGSYPPPQASSSPSSPSAMAAYTPSTTAVPASGNLLRVPQHQSLSSSSSSSSSSADARAKRKESQLALARKAHPLTHQQTNDSDSKELLEDVIALAYRLGKKIYHVDKFAPWLEKHCSPLGSSNAASNATASIPRRGNESANTTAESPIGSPQAQHRSAAVNGQSMSAAVPSWSTTAPKPNVVDTPSPAVSSYAPSLVSSLPLASMSLSISSTALPTTTASTALPSFQAPFLMVEDLKGQFKAMYKEFPFDSYGCSTVPFLNLDAPPGCSPFLDSETIRKHKEMQRQYQQKLDQRKREKTPAITRHKRTTSAPAARRDTRRLRDRSPPQAPAQEAAEMWEGEDGGGMADASLQTPHLFRSPSLLSPAPAAQRHFPSAPVGYSPAVSSTPSSSSSSSSMYQQRRLAPLAPVASMPPCGGASSNQTPLSPFACPAPLLSSSPTFGLGAPRPPSHPYGSVSSSLLARAYCSPSDRRERLSVSCAPHDSSGRGEAMQAPESMDHDGSFMHGSA